MITQAVQRALGDGGGPRREGGAVGAADWPYSGPASNVSVDVRVGMNVDYQAMDLGPVLKARQIDNRRPRAIPGLFCLHWKPHSAPLGDGSGRPNDPKKDGEDAGFSTPDLTIRPENKGLGHNRQMSLINQTINTP